MRITVVGFVLLLTIATASAQAPIAGSVLSLTATPVNIAEAGPTVKINIVKWSTVAEQEAFMTATIPPPKAAAPLVAGEAAVPAPAAPAAAPAAAPPFNPMKSLAAAIDKAPTIGIFWTNENAGYPIRYAYHAALPDGSERIILATSRSVTSLSSTPEAMKGPDFTIIELKMNSKGVGEGKASLNTKVVVDIEDKTVALGNYSAAPVVLKNVSKRSPQ
jgi:hypothetical protein